MTRLQVILAAVGCMGLLMGALLIVWTAFAAPLITEAQTSLSIENATYVGSKTCFTCHIEDHQTWESGLTPIAIQEPRTNPQAITVSYSGAETIQVGGDMHAYTANDMAFAMSDQHHQRYVMQTDASFLTIPNDWDAMVNSEGWQDKCAECHTVQPELEGSQSAETLLGCETCHGPGSIHIETATMTPENQRAVRRAIIASIPDDVCTGCHENIRGLPIDSQLIANTLFVRTTDRE
jgi:hypothetical protein